MTAVPHKVVMTDDGPETVALSPSTIPPPQMLGAAPVSAQEASDGVLSVTALGVMIRLEWLRSTGTRRADLAELLAWLDLPEIGLWAAVQEIATYRRGEWGPILTRADGGMVEVLP